MRIADITEFYSPRGGVRSHLNTKGRVLRHHGHDHLVLAPGRRDRDEPLDSELEPSARGSARVIELRGPTLPYDSDYQLLYRLGKVHRALRAFRPDVVTINSLYMAALALRTLPRELTAVKTVFWHADFVDIYIASRFAQRWSQTIVRPLWAAVRQVLNHFAATFVASRSQAEKLRGHGVERVIQIPFGVDRSTFRPEARSAQRRRELLGPEPGAVLLVAMSRLSGEKSWDTVLDGFRRVRARRQVRLVIFGGGPEAARLRAHGDQDGIQFMGVERDRRRLAEALASSDLFVHGAANETYGFSIAEAIACGVPVVVPNAGAVVELAKPSFSELYEANSAAACAAALFRVLDGDIERYRTGAREESQHIPSSEEQILRLVDAYATLLGSGRQRSVEASAEARGQGVHRVP